MKLLEIYLAILILTILPLDSARSFIPKTRTILDRTVRNHGRGPYSIQLEVNFRNSEGSQIVIENWIIENAESMYLEVRGVGLNYFAIFKNKQKFFLDEAGAERSQKLGGEFFEDLFHYRSIDGLHSKLIGLQVLPARPLSVEPKFRSSKEPKIEYEPFLRLSRSSGVVQYALGKPTPVTSSQNLPGIWIEQDRFNIRRLRFPTQTELAADDYNEYKKGLLYPKLRTINWQENSVAIRTVFVNSINLSQEHKARLQPSILRNSKQPRIQISLEGSSMGSVISEFYQKFR